jgi:DNA-binding NarL/FixJ family response regulator
VVLCGNEVVRHGIVALLPDEWKAQTAIAQNAGQLAETLGDSCVGSIIDAEVADASEAARVTRGHGAAVVVLVDSAAGQLAPWIVEHADAILVRDNVDQLLLRMALVTRRTGMRLVPRALPPSLTTAGDAEPQLSDQARRALALLADGRRYAEIAGALNLSESAVRKLVQRTMHGMGARTRCQAIAIAARTGQLP